MSNIDRSFVKKSFNASAETYDRYAKLQKETIGELLDLVNPADFSILRALDIGAGTGNLTAGLIQKFPDAKVFGCDLAFSMLLQAQKKTGISGIFSAADAELLSYKNSSFELAVSSFTFQWLNSWDKAVKEIKRVLKPGGTFAFSIFGSKTFFELRQSYLKACRETGYSGGEPLELSVTEQKIKTTLLKAGFSCPLMRSYCVTETYLTVNDVLKAIRGMGAKNASGNRNRTPGVRKTLLKMIRIYEDDFEKSGKIPATFEIIAGRAQTS